MSENATAVVAMAGFWGKVLGAGVGALALGALLCLFMEAGEGTKQRWAFPLVVGGTFLLTFVVMRVIPPYVDHFMGTNLMLGKQTRLLLWLGTKPVLLPPVTLLALVGLRLALERLPSRTGDYVLAGCMFFIALALVEIWLSTFRPLMQLIVVL